MLGNLGIRHQNLKILRVLWYGSSSWLYEPGDFPRLEPYQHVFLPLPTHTGSPQRQLSNPPVFQTHGKQDSITQLVTRRVKKQSCGFCFVPPAKSTTHQSPGHLQPALALAPLHSCAIKYSHIHVFALLSAPWLCQAAIYLPTNTHCLISLHVLPAAGSSHYRASSDSASHWMGENTFMGCSSCVSILSSSNSCTSQQAYTEN